ncbi:MAG: DNA double-strand break repair nuclease NurA [Anaerolineales bacterium]|nr:DNA double-strand break repair nuclease NurA [Anaerolineales bacterium]
MAIDFQEIKNQIQEFGETALRRQQEISARREQAEALLAQHASNAEFLLERVKRITRLHDPNLRCAIPAVGLKRPPEPLDARVALPHPPARASLLAADGSQSNPNRHDQVDFCLINVGAIQAGLGDTAAPQITIHSRLVYDEALFTDTGVLTEAQIALMRDLNERLLLSELATQAAPPVITFTDGPLELWGGADPQTTSSFSQSLEEYKDVLRSLCAIGATTAGYVDKPAANLLVRLLEIAALDEGELGEVKSLHPLRRVSDRQLFQRMLAPGDRSAVFAIQSRFAAQYMDELALHFFYINVGRVGKPWLARVEIPGWVADDPERLEALHAVLFQQCQVMGSRPFPYLIHRAHEAAVVSLEEKDQVGQMLVAEMYRRGLGVDDVSSKQFAKDQALRTRYER